MLYGEAREDLCNRFQREIDRENLDWSSRERFDDVMDEHRGVLRAREDPSGRSRREGSKFFSKIFFLSVENRGSVWPQETRVVGKAWGEEEAMCQNDTNEEFAREHAERYAKRVAEEEARETADEVARRLATEDARKYARSAYEKAFETMFAKQYDEVFRHEFKRAYELVYARSFGKDFSKRWREETGE